MNFILLWHAVLHPLNQCHSSIRYSIGASRQVPPECTLPRGSNSFIFTHIFAKKMPISEVGAPQRLSTHLPMENPESATEKVYYYSVILNKTFLWKSNWKQWGEFEWHYINQYVKVPFLVIVSKGLTGLLYHVPNCIVNKATVCCTFIITFGNLVIFAFRRPYIF